MKRSSLKRSTTPMRRSEIQRKPPTRSQAMRNSTLAPRSKKTAAIYRKIRVPLVRRLLEERHDCEAGLPMCTGRSVHLHELLARSAGGSIIDEENIITVCGACHTFITENRIESEKLGLRKSRYQTQA